MKKIIMIIIAVNLFFVSFAPNIFAGNDSVSASTEFSAENPEIVHSIDPELAEKANKFITKKYDPYMFRPTVFGYELTGEYMDVFSSTEIEEIQSVLDQTNSLLDEIKEQSALTGEASLVNLSTNSYGMKRKPPLEYNTRPLNDGFRDIEITWNSITLWLTKTDMTFLIGLSAEALVPALTSLITSTLGLGSVPAIIAGAALQAAALYIQVYVTTPYASKITWNYSDLTGPDITCQIASECRM